MRLAPGSAVLVTALLTSLSSLGACTFVGGSSEEPTSREAWVDAVLAAEHRRDVADPLLSLAIRSDDPVVRMFGYRALGRIGDPSALEPLLRNALEEPRSELRAEAVMALGALASARVVDAIEPFAIDVAWPVRRAVARALGRTPSERVLPPLFDLLADADPDVRAEAALSIARRVTVDRGLVTPRSLPAFEQLGTLLERDAATQVRAAATYAIAKLEQPSFAPFLAIALDDVEPDVRSAAAAGFAALPHDPGHDAPLLAALAVGEERFTVIVQLLKALARAPSPEVVIAVAPLLRTAGGAGHPSHHVRAAAIQVFAAKTDGLRAADPLFAITPSLDDPSPTVRAAALDAYAKLAPVEAAIGKLEEVAQRSRGGGAAKFLRGRVAGAAASLGEPGYPIVERLLQDDDAAVRAAALAALPSFAARGAALDPLLRRGLEERDVAPREAAAGAVAALRRTGLANDLLAALADSPGPEFIEARLALLRAFAALSLFERAESLRPSIADEEIEVRRVAREQIARLGGLLPRAEMLPLPPPPFRPIAGVDFLTGGPRPVVEFVSTKGAFRVEVLVEDAPYHAKAFLERCRAGFYDGLGFHRLVPGFVVQGLDPRGDGYGSGGASLRGEPNQVRYARGVVGAPDAGPDTGGCQMFVTFQAEPRLDDRYTVYGQVLDGMDVVERLDVGDVVEYVLVPKAPASR
jgi:cyclophilin family peptidyl-prolyl cis-trans isomerase/HEAT repeat protein